MLAERVKEWTQEWKEEGMQQGLQQGMQQGIQQGAKKVLVRQLNKKFGAITPELEDKLQQADEEQLMEWLEQILTANSFGDIFGH